MFTKTITLSGDALSSFLAAGGQTVNPNAAAAEATTTPTAIAATTPAAIIPVVVKTTSSVAPVVATTTPSTRAGFGAATTTTSTAAPTTTSTTSTTSAAPTTSSTPSTTSTTTSSSTSSTSTSIISTTSSAAATTSSATTLAPVKAAATSSARVSSVRSAAANALTASKSKTSSSGIGGGGIAGIIIALLIVAAIVGALLFFWRKRKNERREEEYAEKSRRDARNEKGMVRLEEEEISTPTSGGGFDFGHLPSIVSTPPVLSDNTTFTRSASPAQMQQGAAVLGIQRPFTPPPGHPAHPNYRQPPALVASRQLQPPVPQGVRNVTPNMPRKPVQSDSAPMQRTLSSNNPFNDPPASTEIAPPLVPATSPPPARVSSPPVIPMPTSVNAVDPRASVASFTAGDDSAHEEDEAVVAPIAAAAVSPRSQTPVQPSMPVAAVVPAAVPQAAPKSTPTVPVAATGEEDSVVRSKSVQRASDNWAARKAHLKNTLALQTASNPTSPAAEQSPFADPAPTIDHEIAAVSPMEMNFDGNNQKF